MRSASAAPGFGRVVASLTLVAVITLIFASARATSSATYGLRADGDHPHRDLHRRSSAGSYEIVSGDLLKLAGVRRRAILVGDGREPRAASPGTRSEPGRDRLRVHRRCRDFVRRRRPAVAREPRLAADRPGSARGGRVDRDRFRLQRSPAGRDRRAGPQARRKSPGRPAATELLIERRGEYVPGQGVPLFELRPPVFAGADWVVKRGFDQVVSAIWPSWACRFGC